MNFGALEVQIFVSLALVLGAVLVAFVCDLLKGNNESLRERNIELRVRQEERERFRELTARTVEAPARTKETPTPAARQEAPPTIPEQPSRTPAWAHWEELDEADRIADEIHSRIEESEIDRIIREDEPEAEEELEAFAEQQPEPAPLEGTPTLHAKVTPIDRLLLERTSAEAALRLAEELARAAQVTADEIEELREERTAAMDMGGADDEEERFLERGTAEGPVEAEARAETSADGKEEDETVEQPLSNGMLAADEFVETVDSVKTFCGAVVAVGIDGQNGTTQDARQAEMLMESLLGQNGLGCRMSDDEYVLVFPGETGAMGQKRFQQISQRLWDHQIRTVAGSSMTFSWGAVETAKGSLSSTVASARERLEQTRRHREHAPSRIQNFRLVKG